VIITFDFELRLK